MVLTAAAASVSGHGSSWGPVLPLLKRDIRTRVGPDGFTYVRLPRRLFKFLKRY